MRRRFWQTGRLLLLAVVCAVLLPIAGSRAQDQPAGADSNSSATPEPKPETTESVKPDDALPFEIQPKVFYVRDREGKLQAVPGMTYEQLMELWKQQRQLAQENQVPPYSLERMEISGTAADGSADLIARFTITLHVEGWVGVPLRLNGAVLREAAEYLGPGEQVLHVDPEGDGHVSWIRGQPEEKHELVLKLTAPVERIGPQSRLRLSVPRATVAQFQLQVPLARAEAEVSEGGTLDAVRPLAGGKSELRVIGLGGDFALNWHPADSNVASLPTILEATSTQLIRLNGRSANTDVKLTVRSLGSEFDHFQVRLPPGADYIGTPEAGISLVAVDAAAAEGKLYDVRLGKKTTGPVEVRLVTERAHNAAQDDNALELAGFEVVGAVRQWGKIAVQVEGNWQVVWGESNHVRAVADVESNVRREELAAGFEYFVQPYSLTARVVPQKTRIRVEPSYKLFVGREDVRMQAQLKFMIRGAKVRTLSMELPGWEVDAVGPANLVNVDAAIAGGDQSLSIPLLQATSGELELTFEARQRLPANAKEIRLELPRLQGDVMAADVVVVSDDPIELLPRLEELQHLAPQTLRPEMSLPKHQQPPLYYRTTGSPARLVADLKIHEQEISSTLSSTLRVSETETSVEQTLAFQVAYQPANHFTLIVPAGIRPERLTIVHEGQQLVATPVNADAASSSEPTPVEVELPSPKIGRCELQISYSRRHAKPPTQANTLIAVPLVVPGEGRLVDNQLSVVSQQEIVTSYPQGPWTMESARATPPGTSNGDDSLALSATRALGEITLAVSSKPRATDSTTTIERALIATQLTDRARQDRVLMRLTTERPRLDVTLPEGADVRTVRVSVDGERVVPEAILNRAVTIPLTSRQREHLLELSYHFASRPAQGSLRLEGPQVVSARWVQQLYWQLVVPAGEHLLFAPANFTAELTWNWQGFIWQRESTLNEQVLVQWVVADAAGANRVHEPALSMAAQSGASPAVANRYLFSTVGEIEPLELYTLNRARLVLLASLPLLLLGLVLIYFPRARHPAVLLLLALAVAGCGLVAPHPAVLLGQASLLGLALAAVAACLAYLTPRAATRPAAPPQGSSYAVVERSVTELYHRAPAGAHHPASTATNPLVPTSPEIEP